MGETPVSDGEGLRRRVSDRYGGLAMEVLTAAEDKDGSPGKITCSPEDDPVTSDLYTDEQAAAVTEDAMNASLGCGNPTALADLEEGEVVLDLGSGGGIDVLLSAKRVGPSGMAYGLDMTDEMLELARKNQREAGAENVEFLKGTIEHVPLPDSSVDVIISNCVINLSADKNAVFREAHRVLRSGGRFAVSDVVIRGKVDLQIRESVEAWIGCVAGALEADDYRSGLTDAGFRDVEIQTTRVYSLDDAREFLEGAGVDMNLAKQADGQFISAFVRATKG